MRKAFEIEVWDVKSGSISVSEWSTVEEVIEASLFSDLRSFIPEGIISWSLGDELVRNEAGKVNGEE